MGTGAVQQKRRPTTPQAVMESLTDTRKARTTMREDHYGPLLFDLFDTTTEPIPTTRAAELVGCSKQRAYTWVNDNRTQLVSVGRVKFGGLGYMTRTNPHYLAATTTGTNTGNLDIGTHLTITSIALRAGHIIITALDDSGATVELVPA
jgi:hypothetical protein